MVGTKNYFFFFPNTALGGEGTHKRQTVTKTGYSLGGLPVEEFIKNKLEQDHLSIDEFEKFALELADPANKEESWVAQAFPFSDIKQIKMQINFFFATITINKTDQRIKGWEPVFLKVGKQKKAIMNPIIKNILAVIAGCLSGSIINMALILTGHKLLPIEGLDPNDMSAFAEIMP